MKKFLLVIGLALGLLSMQAAQVSSSIPAAARTNILLSTSGALTSLLIANTGAAVLNIAVIDNNATNQTYSISQYTNRISYKTNIVTSWTDINGVANVLTNDAMVYIDQTVAAYNGSYTKVLMLTVPTNTTFTYTPINPIMFGKGILITNDVACNLTATYSSVK